MRVLEDEDAIRRASDPPAEPWDEFVHWVKRLYTRSDFDWAERGYKLEVAEEVRKVREHLEANDDQWSDALRAALTRKSNLTHYITHGRFLDWVEEAPEAAESALRRLWTDGGSPGERVRAFLAELPREVLHAPGGRLNIASVLLLGDDPRAFVPYKPTYFHRAMALTGWEPPSKEADEGEVYDDALRFLDAILEESGRRGVKLRDRLDAQGVIWAIVKWPDRGFDSKEFAELERYRGDAPRVWWVNQGNSEQRSREHEGEFLSARVETDSGAKLAHWHNVSLLRVGDIVLHYWDRSLRAISRVAKRPDVIEPEWLEGKPANRARIEMTFLEEPVALSEIPLEWRTDEASERGPFDRKGGVKQRYLLPLSIEIAEKLRSQFSDRWPEGSPWEDPKRGAWLFQSKPRQWSLEEYLRDAEEGDESEWRVNRFADEMRVGDPVVLWQTGDHAGVYAVAEITGEPVTRNRVEWDREAEGEAETAIPYRLVRILDRHIPKRELVDDPVLGSLTVIRAPQGTTFRVTQEQWAALQKRLVGPSPPIDRTQPTFAGIRSAIAHEGLRIPERLLRRFHLSLQTRGFVVLSGLSGSGKTWLAEAYARAVGAEWIIVPVAPSWTSNEDLLGYFNPIEQRYFDTEFSRFLRRASEEQRKSEAEGREPRSFILILDEMNLARVEHYFAKFLSAMELRHRGSARIELAPGEHVRLTPNLRFVGTVNVDETTHGFADKVYDRAQLVELEPERSDLEAYLGEAPYRDEVLRVWDAVREEAPFAFRVLAEIRAYIDEAETLDVPWDHALDEQILQKVLPKLTGWSVGSALQRLVELSADRYPLTHAKASRMLEGFRAHGFASYF